MSGVRDALAAMGLPRGDLHELPESTKRFPDGAQYRVEIPSTEGPACLVAVLHEAERLDVRVHRVSQGSGVFMLTVRGQEQLVAVLEDARRAAAHGIRSVLLADVGALSAFAALREAGELPAGMQAKMSVMLPIANPATARVLEQMGASTLNVTPDLSLAQIAAIRAAVDCPLDVYVEVPGNLGGFVRLHEIPDLVRVAAPVYLKFGVRNAPDIYPSGGHLEATALLLSRERVRRTRLGLELLARSGYEPSTSELGAAGLAVPVQEALRTDAQGSSPETSTRP